jgi:hypothetical protein
LYLSVFFLFLTRRNFGIRFLAVSFARKEIGSELYYLFRAANGGGVLVGRGTTTRQHTNTHGMHSHQHQGGKYQRERNNVSSNLQLKHAAWKHQSYQEEAIEWYTREMAAGSRGWICKLWSANRRIGIIFSHIPRMCDSMTDNSTWIRIGYRIYSLRQL